jgi:hypothetical protein
LIPGVLAGLAEGIGSASPLPGILVPIPLVAGLPPAGAAPLPAALVPPPAWPAWAINPPSLAAMPSIAMAPHMANPAEITPIADAYTI